MNSPRHAGMESKTKNAPRRGPALKVLALLAIAGLSAGIGLATVKAGTDLRARSLSAAAERAPGVLQLPRVVVTPSGAATVGELDAPHALEGCTRLRC